MCGLDLEKNCTVKKNNIFIIFFYNTFCKLFVCSAYDALLQYMVRYMQRDRRRLLWLQPLFKPNQSAKPITNTSPASKIPCTLWSAKLRSKVPLGLDVTADFLFKDTPLFDILLDDVLSIFVDDFMSSVVSYQV